MTRTTSAMMTWLGSFRCRTPAPSPPSRGQSRSRLSSNSETVETSSSCCSAEPSIQSVILIETVWLTPLQRSHDAKRQHFTHHGWLLSTRRCLTARRQRGGAGASRVVTIAFEHRLWESPAVNESWLPGSQTRQQTRRSTTMLRLAQLSGCL